MVIFYIYNIIYMAYISHIYINHIQIYHAEYSLFAPADLPSTLSPALCLGTGWRKYSVSTILVGSLALCFWLCLANGRIWPMAGDIRMGGQGIYSVLAYLLRAVCVLPPQTTDLVTTDHSSYQVAFPTAALTGC